MRIAVVSEFAANYGAAIAALRQAQGLRNAGHEVGFFHFGGPVDRAFPLEFWNFRSGLSDFLLRGMRVISGPIAHGVVFDFRTNWLVGALRAFRPDVINVHNHGSFMDHAGHDRLLREAPVVATLHDMFFPTGRHYVYTGADGAERKDPPRQIVRPMFDVQAFLRNLPQRTRVVAPSRWLCDVVRQQSGHAIDPILIPYGLRTEDFHPAPESSRPHDKLRILFVAASVMHARKNFRLVVDNLQRIQELGYEVQVLGRVPDEEKARFEGVQWLGVARTPEELRHVYTQADLLVHPALIDNLPNTVLESIFCGTPVLGANTGGVPDMVVPGESGWLFDPYSAGDFLGRLAWLAGPGRGELQALRGERVASWARDRFPASANTRAYEELFASL